VSARRAWDSVNGRAGFHQTQPTTVSTRPKEAGRKRASTVPRALGFEPVTT